MKRKIMALILAVMMIMSSVSVSAFALGTCKIKVDTVDGMPGQTITVNVAVENNPGILGLSSMSITYDSDALTLTNAENGEAFSALTFTRPSKYKSGCVFSWYAENIQDSDVTDGTILKLTFTVNSSATEGSYEIGVSCPPGNVYDKNLDEITPEFENGSISIVSYKPGDVDGNGLINARDLILIARYIADGCTTDPDGWNVVIIAEAANVNNDTRINALDLILIARYIADGCETDPDGYNVRLVPSTSLCSHSLEHIDKIAATCTVDGNIEYWHCTKCGKYFSNAGGTAEISQTSTVVAATGHHAVVDAAVPATTTSTGLTEGSHCDVCGEVIVPQTIIPMLAATQYAINYHISNGDNYLSQLNIENTNPSYYTSESGLPLKNLSVEGYIFEGWYDMEGSNGQLVRTIPAGTTGEIDLYAKWTVREYKITFDSPLVPVASKFYSVNTGTTLSNPALGNYVFMGWTDDDCNIVRSIAPGTTGDMTLHANWTSRRNLTKPISNYGDPIVVEDTENGTILFAYEIGTIENVPLSNLSEIYTAVSGMSQTYTTSGTTSVTSSSAQTIANTIQNATTSSGAWSLSADWNSVSSVSEAYATQQGWTKEEAETHAKTSTDTYSLNSSSGGTSTTTDVDGTSSKLSNSSSSQSQHSREQGVEISAEGGVSYGIASVKFGAKYDDKTTQTNTYGSAVGREDGSDRSHSSSSSSTWNTTESRSNSNTVSSSQTVSNILSNSISESKNYGSSYAEGGSNSTSQSFANSTTESDQYSTAITYSCAETTTTTQTFEFGGESEGYYRVVLAGTAHVYGVVGYDVTTSSYFVYTYSVIDDNTYAWVDYSKTSAQFNDYENGVLCFEAPFDIYEYVQYKTYKTDGLELDTSTGIIEGYTGVDSIVFIPDYIVVDNIDGQGNAKAVNVKGISSTVFQGRDDIVAVSTCGSMNEIPNNAFEGCTSLQAVYTSGVTIIGDNAFAGCILLKAAYTSNLTRIGNNAFDGCSLLSEFTVPRGVVFLGDNAFNGLDRVFVDASCNDVANASVTCGAEEIVLNISAIDQADGLTLEVPASTNYFELQGGNKVYKDIQINSQAEETCFNGLTIEDCTRIPLVLSSQKLTFNGVEVTSPGYVMLLSSNNVNVVLYQVNRFTSLGGNAVVCRNINFSALQAGVTSKLNVLGNIYICGNITNANYLSVLSGSIIYINEDDFANYIKGSFNVLFDANGGSVSTIGKTVYCGSEIGELPTPTRDYYTFVGWFTEADGGVQILPETILTNISDTQLFSHWTLNPTSGWVLASEMPEDAQIVSQKWTYDLTTNTTSNQNELEGYTLYDTTSEWGEYGDWSAWSDTAITGSDSREVGTQQAIAGYNTKTQYHYERWYRWNGSYYTAWKNEAGGGPNYEQTNWLDFALPHQATDSGVKEYGRGYNANGVAGADKDIYWYNETTRTVDNPNSPIYKTQYRYRDRELVYTYYFTKTESFESQTEIFANDSISNVQAWVQYRAK